MVLYSAVGGRILTVPWKEATFLDLSQALLFLKNALVGKRPKIHDSR